MQEHTKQFFKSAGMDKMMKEMKPKMPKEMKKAMPKQMSTPKQTPMMKK